jgi:TPR repeat protein
MRITLLLTSVLVTALLSASSVMAGALEDCSAAFERDKDFAKALQLCLPLAEQGNARVQVGIGFMYFRGLGVPQDHSEAVKWYRKAAEQGDVEGQDNLANCYETGRGVLQNDAEAAKWYRKAAEQGDVEGQVRLGMMYWMGHLVPKDLVLAYMWLNLAITQGEENHLANDVINVGISFGAGKLTTSGILDQVAAQMTPAQIAEAKQLAREWKPTTPSP